jgi:PAS domain-containing protein
VRLSVSGPEGQGDGAAVFPVGGGELGALIRAFDWSSTSLGPVTLWPQSLKTTVGLLLLSPVPIVLLWGDEGIMIYNDAYSVFAGGRHPKLLGCKVREGWPEVADFNDNVMKVGLAGGVLAYTDQELTLYRHDRPEQVWMNLDYSPVLDESGRPAGVIAIVVETTQRILADRRLRENEARFRALTNATSEMIFWMSPDWTEMRLLEGRFSLPGIEGPSVYWRNEYIFPEDEATIQAEIDRAVATGSAFQLEHRVRRSDGTAGWTFSRAVPLFGDGGQILEWFGAATDVTERRRTEARREALILLTAEIQALQEPACIAYAAAKILGEALGASRVGYGTIDPTRTAIHVERNWTAPGVASLEGLLPLDSMATVIDELRRGRVTAVADVTRDPRTAAVASWLTSLDIRAFLNVAVIEKDRPTGVFFVNDAKERLWVKEDIDLICEVAARARTAIERRLAEEALRSLANSLELQVEQRTHERDRVWRNTQDLCVVMDRRSRWSVGPRRK